MTDIQKEIASVEEFKKTLTFEHPIPVSWAISKYKAQHELIEQLQGELERRIIQADINISLGETVINMQAEIEQKDAEIAQLKDQRNRALAEWGKTIEDAEIIEEANKQLMEAIKQIEEEQK